MRRIVGAVLIWLLFVGGIGLYTGFRAPASLRSPESVIRPWAEGRWVAEVTTSFLPEPDPFLAVISSPTTEPAVVILCNGVPVPVTGGSLLRRSLTGLTVGRSEILADVSPPVDDASRAHAVRLRVVRDGVVVAETTAWSAPGTRVLTSVVVDGEAP